MKSKLVIGLSLLFAILTPTSARPASARPVLSGVLSGGVYAQENNDFRTIIDQLAIIQRRMKAATERMERFTERLESRQTKLAQQGAQTYLIDRMLNQSQAKLKLADQEVLNLDVTISEAANASPPYAEIGTTIDQVKKTKTAVIAVFESVKKTSAEVRRVSENL